MIPHAFFQDLGAQMTLFKHKIWNQYTWASYRSSNLSPVSLSVEVKQSVLQFHCVWISQIIWKTKNLALH